MSLALWHWHIEISSKCTLRCSRCARIEVPDTLVNTDLKLEFFQNHFTSEFIKTNVEKITFCGDDGDPIYAHDLIKVIQYIKSVKPVEIVIITNGSYKSKEWWTELAQVLDSNDEVHFSLDGWDQASNEQYRVNCNWDSIVLGIKTVRKHSEVFMRWSAIAFAFNELNLEAMRLMAIELGFDTFQLTKSTKFGEVNNSYLTDGNDVLQPNSGLISHEGRFTREITQLSNRVYKPLSIETNRIKFNEVVNNELNSNTTPLCFIGNKGLYISSTGIFYPCCWVANRYTHNKEWNSTKFDMSKQTLSDILKDAFWTNEFLDFGWHECKTKCQSSEFKHCNNW